MSALMRALYFKVGYRLGKMPGDTGKPQPGLVDLAAKGGIAGRILDIGCGAGDNSLHLATHGHKVLGIDYSAAAIGRAKQAARQRGIAAEFRVADIFALSPDEVEFDTAIDFGVFHQFRGVEIERYVDCLRRLMPGRQTLVVQCFNDEAKYAWPMPRCISKDELHEAFRAGWRIDSIERVLYETRTEGDVPAWLAIIRRTP